jgi:hypothetical protein
MAEETVRRGAGRPRKQAASDVSDKKMSTFASDDRVGTRVDNPNWSSITFEDDREYLCEDGVITERVR